MPGQNSKPTPSNPSRSWLLPLGLVSVVVLYLWPVTYLFGIQRVVGSLVLLVGLLLCLEYNRRFSAGSREWGFDFPALWPALWRVALLFIPLLTIIVVISWWGGTAGGRDHPVSDFMFLFPWALAQQFALQTVLLREFRYRTTPARATVLAAATFAALHLPNPFLAGLTFTGGLLTCMVFVRYPNLFPLALAHSLLSLACLALLPRAITGGMRVGFAYFLR